MEEKGDKVRQKTIEQELEWVRENPKGRRKKAKARLNNYEALLAEERNVKLDQVQIHIPAGPRLGDVVVEAEGLRKGFGDRLLIEDLTFKLPRGGIVGVIGPNGAGKTTLFRMITGQEQPDAGTLTVGETVELAYVDQSRDALDDEKTVWEEISGGMDTIKVGDQTMNSRAYCSSWNFKGSEPAEEGRQALRRRAQPPAPGQAAARRRQRPAARRADERPRRRHAARAGRGAARVRRLRGGHLARSLVPRPRRDARARVRGRLAGALVRGQLRGLRGAPPRAARRRGRPPAPHHVQAPDAYVARGAGKQDGAMADVGITEYTDPGCPWAYSAEPFRRRLHVALRRRDRSGAGAWSCSPRARRSTSTRASRRRSCRKGFDEDRPRPRHADRHVAAPADGGDGAGLPRDRRRAPARAGGRGARCCARFACARCAASCSTRSRRCTARPPTPASIPPSSMRWSAGDDVESAMREDMAAAREPSCAARVLDERLANWSGGRRYTCPSYEIVRRGDGVQIAVPGFQPFAAYDVVLANLVPGPERREPPASVLEVLEWAGEPLATREVAVVWTSTTPRRARSSAASPTRRTSAPTASGAATA